MPHDDWSQRTHDAKPRPLRQPVPGERVDEFTVGGVVWRIELRAVRDVGVEAQILERDELRAGRLFPFREQAVAWGKGQRRMIEAGSFDAG
jgi:hypothetical protein